MIYSNIYLAVTFFATVPVNHKQKTYQQPYNTK